MINTNQQMIPRKKSNLFKIRENVTLMFNYIILDALSKENYSLDLFKSSNSQIKEEPDYDSLTVIIPYRHYENNPENTENLFFILEYLTYVGVKHVIISEESDYPKINEYLIDWSSKFENLTILFTESHTEFNKPNSINEAVKECSTPYLAIMDYPVMIPKSSFDYALKLVDSFYDFVYGSNYHYKKITNKLTLIKDFNFNNVDSKPDYDFKLYQNILFCKKEYLMQLGGYNNLFISDCHFDVELLVRIILSKFTLFFVEEYAYPLNFPKKTLEKDLKLLIYQYNFAKVDDVHALIYQNEYLYNNSQTYNDKEPVELETNDYLLTVVVPVYNCEFFYIDRCINSLKNQTLGFENIEVILVDDASIYQSSIDLINSYVEKYSNVKAIFLEENSGAGIARNAGIKAATADYITFLDHDDYYVDNICEITYKNISKGDTDIVITNFINLAQGIPLVNEWNFLELENGEKYLADYSDDLNVFSIPPSTGTKTFRKEFLHDNQLFYTNYKSGQDRLFNEMTLFKANGIKIIDTPSIIYNYRQNTNENLRSTSLKNNKTTLMDKLRVYNKCYELYLENDVDELINKLHVSLDYWIKSHFLHSNLTKEEIKIIVDESYHLFAVFKQKPEIKVKYRKLYNAFTSKNYDRVYAIYNQNK